MGKSNLVNAAENSGEVSQTAEFAADAFKYVSRWCAAARRFVDKKLERWKLLEDLYHNRRDLKSWDAGYSRIPAYHDGTAANRWQADIVLSPSYIVDSWANKAYQAVFSGPEWLTVIPENLSGPVDETQYPGSYKLQELLLSRLSEGRIHTAIYEALQHLVLFGSVYAKVFWYSKTIRQQRLNFETLEINESDGKIFDCPILQVIPLNRMLLDWNASHSDVQRYSGIGHRVDKTFDQITSQFNRGVYSLNQDEVVRRWDNSSLQSSTDELLHDEDGDDLDADLNILTVWEWHGRIPGPEGGHECLCSIITERDAVSPEDGVMVRLTEGPVLWSGLRPFVAAHYTPIPGPLGMGAVESNLDLIHSISQFISQSQDNARLTANAQLMVRRGSSAARQLGVEGDAVYPGKVWTVDEPGDVQPFPPMNFPQQDVNHLIQYLNMILEKRTSISDASLGVSAGAKTATEAHILQASADAPFAARTDLFARTFLEPLGQIAIAMLQQFLLDDQVITIRNSGGIDVPIVITSEELQAGRYKVAATLTRQDSTRIAKAQSIERILPTLANFQPLLEAEGMRVSFTEVVKRYLDLVGIEGADRVLNRVELPGNGSIPVKSQSPDSADEEASPRSHVLLEDGGPMGTSPTDANAVAKMLQMQAMTSSPGSA